VLRVTCVIMANDGYIRDLKSQRCWITVPSSQELETNSVVKYVAMSDWLKDILLRVARKRPVEAPLLCHHELTITAPCPRQALAILLFAFLIFFVYSHSILIQPVTFYLNSLPPMSEYEMVRIHHDLVQDNPRRNPIILASFPGSADNVASWQTAGGCPGIEDNIYPPVQFPSSLCFIYDHGGVMKACIAGKMCQKCLDALVPDGWNTYSAPYQAGTVASDGSWTPMSEIIGHVDENGILTQRVVEQINTQEFTETINGLEPERWDRSSGLTRMQIALPSYEFAATWKALIKDRKPFYCDMINLEQRYNPEAPREQENLRIRLANDPYYARTRKNFGFSAGENTLHEIKTVGTRHLELSRNGINVSSLRKL
jgi:hypothetical protein